MCVSGFGDVLVPLEAAIQHMRHGLRLWGEALIAQQVLHSTHPQSGISMGTTHGVSLLHCCALQEATQG